MSERMQPPVTKGFAPTRWTLVLQARGDSPEARMALGELCASYYDPVLRFLRQEGRTEADARELAQEFFARVLAGNSFAHVDPEKGRFRSFLLGGLRHFLSDLRDRNRAEKRGWGMEHEPLGVDTDTCSGADVEDRNEARPEEQFDREWAIAVTARALQVVAGEFEGEGRGNLFQQLKPWLVGSAAAPPQEAVAAALGISEGALKVAIHRLRKRFREAVRREVAQTVPDFADVDAELRYLVEVLARG